jgi:hypothetical protein
MKHYPDPEHHRERHIHAGAWHYVEGLEQSGLPSNDHLPRAMSEQVAREAKESYRREVDGHHLNGTLRNQRRKMNEIKRRGQRARLWTCSLLAGLLGGIAYYSFVHAAPLPGLLYSAGALLFLGMLIIGTLYDRPDDRA